jgi:hypothetical protein
MFYARHGTIDIPQGSGFYADFQKIHRALHRPGAAAPSYIPPPLRG